MVWRDVFFVLYVLSHGCSLKILIEFLATFSARSSFCLKMPFPFLSAHLWAPLLRHLYTGLCSAWHILPVLHVQHHLISALVGTPVLRGFQTRVCPNDRYMCSLTKPGIWFEPRNHFQPNLCCQIPLAIITPILFRPIPSNNISGKFSNASWFSILKTTLFHWHWFCQAPV